MKSVAIMLKDVFRSKNSWLVIISIVFSIIIPILIFSVSDSFIQTTNEETNKIYGYFDSILYKSNETNNSIKNGHNVVSFGSIKTFISNGNLNLGYIDEQATTLGNIKLIEGIYPQQKGEIVICNSLKYKNSEFKINSVIAIGNSNYKIVGIVNDYSTVWNKPLNDKNIVFPNILLSPKEALMFYEPLQEHILLKTSTDFTGALYKEFPYLISNTNKSINNQSEKYQVPFFVVILTTLCSLLFNIYIFSYYFENEKRKLSIFRFLALNQNQTITYITSKIVILLFVSIPIGAFGGYLFSYLSILAFNFKLNLNHKFIFSFEYLLTSILICLIVVVVSIIIISKDISKVSPLDLFNKKTKGCSYKICKEKKLNIFKLALLELKLHLKETIILIILVSIAFSLFISLSLYMNVYSSSVSDVHGRMPLTFDYEFMTNLDISDTSYIDENNQVISIKNFPDEDSIYYLMDHNNIIPDTIIENLRKNPNILRVNKYLESNDLYLLNPPSETCNAYLSGYLTDEILPFEVSSIFNIQDNVRGIQFFGYSEKELLDMSSYVIEGEINIDKIRSGEEVILMVPIYECTEYDGYTEQHFINQEDYSNKKNQFKDNYYSVGDTISFIQFYSSDYQLKGYLNSNQMKNKINYSKHTVKIGAIIPERICWFDNLTQPPTAYTLVGLNESFEILDVLPTVSRIQIFLKNTTSYELFDADIMYYQNELTNFNFRNNAAEMQDFKEFQTVINTLCYMLILIVCLVVVSILCIEDKITFYRNRRFYSLLHLNGLSNLRIKKMLIVRAIIVATICFLISTIITLIIMNFLFGGIASTLRYFNISNIILPIVILIVTIIVSPVISITKNNGTTFIQSINE